MKKVFLVFVAMLALGLFSACDPAYFIDYSVRNKSGHDVTIYSTFPSDRTLWNNNPNGIAVSNGQDTLFCTTEGLGSANLATAKSDIRTWVYGDTVTFMFDDGKQLVYSQSNEDGVFDVNDSHYSWSSEKDWMILLHYNKYGHLKYTITEEDYNRAQ